MENFQHAIFQFHGKQYFAKPGDVLFLDKISEQNPGDKIIFDHVMMVNDQFGSPQLENFVVTATFEKYCKAKKIVIFKFRRKKNSKVKTGHRQMMSRIKINEIIFKTT